MKYRFVPIDQIQTILKEVGNPVVLCRILSDIFRINILYMIKRAGSGHIGTSLSAIDILTWLWTQELIDPNEEQKEEGDIFFSSKGHDVPALYSVLLGLGKLDYELIHTLRRFEGLPGHPDVGTPFIVTNTGSLGMGVSKARGMAIARRHSGKKGRIFVLTGDGELQEGQFWESLQPTANGKFSEITVIVDHNKMQSDTWVRSVSDLGDLEKKCAAFGWEVKSCDGHDFASLQAACKGARLAVDRPQIIIAHTIKGKGVSFMEGERGMTANDMYRYHGGAISDDQYKTAIEEISERLKCAIGVENKKGVDLETVDDHRSMSADDTTIIENILDGYSSELMNLGEDDNNIFVLDGDLITSQGLVPFRERFPDRFIECGIAEQDMVSVAGGLALQGKIPVVHSFACFLGTRGNEQVYNNTTERKKIIYTGTLAGILPGFTGHSHQSVNDIGLMSAMPGLVMLQPCNALEARMSLNWAIKENTGSTYLRICNLNVSTEEIKLPENYVMREGHGFFVREGMDAVCVAYGPVMLAQAVQASDMLCNNGFSVAVINLPWLNRLDRTWFNDIVCSRFRYIFTIDDHYEANGQGAMIGSTAASLTANVLVKKFGLKRIPACGENENVLRYHKLDAASIAETIEDVVRR
ncbi:MAG: transketolase C-terminal domain-containing protein [Desulfuromusa sp.]|nr:transketolase C-terminal domain-containing protein [Desulfuromusa sp.]